MKHCDGFHADRFLVCIQNTRLANPLPQTSYDEQVQQLVDFWIVQLGAIGLRTTPHARNVAIQLARESIDRWLLTLLPTIEQHNLPIYYGAPYESQSG
jgi:hypothetical protein